MLFRITPRITSPSVLALAALLGACASPMSGGAAAGTAAAPMREVGGFVVRLGTDTVSVEQFTRTLDRLEGRQVLRSPRLTLRDYSATLDADGAITQFELTVRNAARGAPTQQASIDFRSDTAVVRITRGDSVETLRVPAPRGSVPNLGYSLALYELPFARLRQAERDTLTLSIVPIGGTAALPLRIARAGTESVRVTNVAGTSRARIDEQGRLLGWDGRGSTLDITAERAANLDLDRLTAEFASREAAGQALGTLSPRDSVQAVIGGATLAVIYGRPSTRGRRIFGEVVPWNEVWRTGANQATHLRTDRALMIGGTEVPAGTYSLFTIPAPEGWTLIVNRQTGQWGTAYDATQDLARIPMPSETLTQPVERFTISIEPTTQGGTLRIAWDNTRASVPFTLR
ncbi:hypothetical protein BH23GEM3_BH23GEM3_05370 [soil metagenome]